MKIKLHGGASVLANRVPQEPLKIARRFNVGFLCKSRQVPEGQLTRHRFSRPCGARSIPNLFPALKRRAIIGKSLWDSVLLATLVLFLAVGTKAETINALSEAEIKGRDLARQLCDSKPETNFSQSGILNIRYSSRNTTNVPVSFKIYIFEHDPTKWASAYFAGTNGQSLMVVHEAGNSNRYQIFSKNRESVSENVPFASSDFLLCDLGLEFFHWPMQKILPKTTNLKRGREYTLLESTNPNPATNGYSRVLSWIDKESGGILQAEAYDAQGKLLKVFEPKSFKKVNGQWELQEMEIRNVQTGSRTRLEFDLKKD